MSAVLVVGSANADLVVPVERRPAGGETVLGGDTTVSPGGKGANTAAAAGRLGADVALLGAVGDDAHGRLLRESLTAAGAGTQYLRTVDRPTGIAYITVTPDGENSILVSPGANSALEPADLTDDVFDGVRVLVTSLEVPLPTVERAVRQARSKGVRVLLNLSPAAELSGETLAALDVLLVNEHEAGYLLAEEDADPRRLLDLGPRAAVVTRGAAGAVVVEDGKSTTVESPRVEAVDTTGAGDAFAGALAASLARGADLVEAARLAVRVAAVSVTRHGAQPSYPTAAELE
ncbi:ribokinase [Amycolatopsis jiangsuensis]|uniref:Ribokinase n=1 Tax=Amycolatopsis jiangsuensis TaxID=1181879 RepID=A0A840J0L6_9PSEU|nr:ribokinase [Amycolatopsis jiangsuensis]MBB4687279.1 ribokinase [Amycolatopsis jiangsuensis]